MYTPSLSHKKLPANRSLYKNINHLTVSAKLLPISPAVERKRPSQPSSVVKAYGLASHRGLHRTYNEDRSVALLELRGSSRLFPQCKFFGLYDGHGGTQCCEFLQDKLHQYVVENDMFPHMPREALHHAFLDADRDFIATHDHSGSCAVVVLFIGNQCYVANVGDSRAVLSKASGQAILDLSIDH